MKKKSFKITLSTLMVLFIAALLVIKVFDIKRYQTPEKVIAWDVISYYAYLPGTFIEHDYTLSFVGTDTAYYRHYWPEVTSDITPRFVPSCTPELMSALGKLSRKYALPVQSHLSENKGEIKWVKELEPDSAFYGEVYDKYGLFGDPHKTVMAHCVYSTDEEIALMKKRGVFVAHCPASNMNVASGIAPVRKYLDNDLRIGLGSDVAGGHTESLFTTMVETIQNSKLYWRTIDQSCKPLRFEEVFFLATKGGGEFFGKVGSFEEGYEFDALVFDDKSIAHPQPLTLPQRLERLVYLGGDRRCMEAKFVKGEKIL